MDHLRGRGVHPRTARAAAICACGVVWPRRPDVTAWRTFWRDRGPATYREAILRDFATGGVGAAAVAIAALAATPPAW